MAGNLYAVVYKTGDKSHPGYRVRVDPANRKRIVWLGEDELDGMPVILSMDQLARIPHGARVAVPKELAEYSLGW